MSLLKRLEQGADDGSGNRWKFPAGQPANSPCSTACLEFTAKKGEREWTRSEINLLEAAADRAGLALENARLVESAQRRASRERSIGEISAKIGAVSDINSILQTAVEELGRKLSGATDVTFELDPDQMKHG